MALAQELYHAAGMSIRRLPEHEQVDAFGHILHQLAEDSVGNIQNLQYSFPLLLLRHSGYNYVEATILTIMISIVVLYQHFMLPGLPEFGADKVTFFGRRLSRAYVTLLRAAIADSFLDILNTPLDESQSTASYLGQYGAVVGHPPFQESLAYFQRLLELLTNIASDRDPWQRQHLAGQARHTQGFAQYLADTPITIGFTTLLNPQPYMIQAKAMPVGVAPQGSGECASFVNFGNLTEQQFENALRGCLGLHIGKCVMFGPDSLFKRLKTNAKYREALAARLTVPWNVRVDGWDMPSSAEIANWAAPYSSDV
jgi:hypothetical protein